MADHKAASYKQRCVLLTAKTRKDTSYLDPPICSFMTAEQAVKCREKSV